MTATISIIIKAIDQTKTALDNQDKNLQKLITRVGAATAALAAAGFAAQQAYQFISEGAQLELAETKFDRLSASINTTADALNRDLKNATGGLMSQAEQMQLAGDLMSLGLAKTHEEAVRLTSVAAQLGMNMNQLVLTLTNQTTMRFDSLGVAVDGFDDKVKKLEATGLSADEAFKWAFIEQAEAQIERVGSIADTTAGDLMKIEAALSDIKNESKLLAAELSSGTIKATADATSSMLLLVDAYKAGQLSTIEFASFMVLSNQGTEAAAAVTEEVTTRMADYENMTRRAYDTQWLYHGAIEGTTQSLSDNYFALNQSTSAEDFYAQKAEEAARASYVAGSAIRDSGAAAQEAANGYSTLSRSVGSTTSSIQEQLDFLQAGGVVVAELIAATNAAIESGDFELAQKLANEASIAATDIELELGNLSAEEAATKLADDLGIGFDEAQQMVTDLQASIFAMTAGNYVINFDLNVEGGGTYIPGVTGTGGSGTPAGTGGGAIPGAGSGGGGVSALSTGGGPVLLGGVTPTSASNPIMIYGDVIVMADSAMDFGAEMLEFVRNTDSVSAGASVAGSL